jgi:hypothetical protein
MITVDRMIGKHYGDGLLARRAENYGLFSQCHDLDEGDAWKLVLVTDQGKFYAQSRFTGATNFNILDALLVDYENQLVYRLKRDYPIMVQPGKEITVR